MVMNLRNFNLMYSQNWVFHNLYCKPCLKKIKPEKQDFAIGWGKIEGKKSHGTAFLLRTGAYPMVLFRYHHRKPNKTIVFDLALYHEHLWTV